MEEKISFKELLKICKECSVSIFFVSVIFGLIYGVYSLISMNWDQYIFPTLIYPILVLFEKYINLISIIIVLINFWFCCVVFKIAKKMKKTPIIIDILATLSFCTMFFMMFFNFAKNNSFNAIILVVSIVACSSIYLIIPTIENQKELKKKNEKQLSLDLEEK